MVVVTVQYRFNLFGFLGAAEMQRQSADGSTGNWGLQDQRLALRWVQDNVAYFGGDPSRVMLFGDSHAVAAHLLAKRSFGLYQRAVLQSGNFGGSVAQPLAHAQRIFDRVAAVFNCSGGITPDPLACLRKVSPTLLLCWQDLCWQCFAVVDTEWVAVGWRSFAQLRARH